MAQCPNCSAELAGTYDEYCGRCGQRRIHPLDLSARHFVRELIDEIVSLDAKFKTLRTLRSLLTPGLLTAEYLAGRRRPHLAPFKVYLVCAALFFLSAPVAGFKLEAMLDADPADPLRAVVAARVAERGIDQALFNARFDVRVQTVLMVSLGVAALVFALALQILFRKKRLPYGAHLIFALHYISFMYLVTVAAGASRAAGARPDVAVICAYAVIVPYLILALKRVYSTKGGSLVIRATLLVLLTFFLNFIADFAATRVTLAIV